MSYSIDGRESRSSVSILEKSLILLGWWGSHGQAWREHSHDWQDWKLQHYDTCVGISICCSFEIFRYKTRVAKLLLAIFIDVNRVFLCSLKILHRNSQILKASFLREKSFLRKIVVLILIQNDIIAESRSSASRPHSNNNVSNGDSLLESRKSKLVVLHVSKLWSRAIYLGESDYHHYCKFFLIFLFNYF